MFGKNRNKKVGICVMVVTASLVLAALWAVLATPETALAKKPVKPDDTTYYSVTMTGDLTIQGAWDCEGYVEITPPDKWGRSFENKLETGIRVNSPLPRICIANAFLGEEVTLDGDVCDDCGEGVIPHGNGPNWGTLTVEGDAMGVFVTWWIGETDAVTGKCKRYKLSTNDYVNLGDPAGTWPNGDGTGTVHTVTIPTGTSWSLVQNKPGKLNTTLTSTLPTVITFTEYTGP